MEFKIKYPLFIKDISKIFFGFKKYVESEKGSWKIETPLNLRVLPTCKKILTLQKRLGNLIFQLKI